MEHRFADCTLDDARLTLTRGGNAVAVEPKVFDLIHLLVRNAGNLVTREQMVDEIWGGRIVSESAISACIAAARKAVGDTGKAQAVIRTVARRGLMLVAEVSAEAAGPASVAVPAFPEAEQRIRYCRSEDGHAIAYAVSGEGPPVLRFGPTSLQDLELEWALGLHRSWVSSMALHARLLRFDTVGSGQSERILRDVDYEVEARDAAAVADAAGFNRFAAVSYSGGCLPALTFAAHSPERLTRLAIVGGFVEGRSRRSAESAPDALRGLIAEGWARPESVFARAFATAYFPDGPAEETREVLRMTQSAAPPEMMLRTRDASNTASVAHLLGQVRCPVLILHARDDAVHPLSQAQQLAAGIPGAELVVLETANHVPLHGSPCWESYNRTLAEFLTG
ncbi:alpha/beta fold hydrolase [Nioella ostreopsis]|uniref:alpha/beta fold hydrolase n=1 Tax=Nioella ostreopsis TaxID=2448479 RepID=UPI000FD7B421|nr:alpha/beta fold hydrolase [Nioella ostreopsis]